VASWLLMLAMAAYLCICAVLFVQWIDPSLNGRTDQHIAADSSTYLYMADVLREGLNDPFVLAALSSFPNTLWMPVLFALALKSTVLMALANLLLFWISIQLFRRTSNIDVGLFLFLLLLNPTTTVSLLSVNKEILDMFAVALFCYFLSTGRKWALWIALLIAFINRYEVCVTMMAFLLIRSRLNPWRNRRATTLIMLTFILTICLPVLAARTLTSRFYEAREGGVIAFLDTLEMHYMFALAVIPKILEDMFGELLNFSHWAQYSVDDLANSYILAFNNLANVMVLLVLAWKRSMKISSEWIYLCWTAAIFMAVSLVIQPRYFYFCFVLLCFQAAQPSMVANRLSRLISAGELVANPEHGS